MARSNELTIHPPLGFATWVAILASLAFVGVTLAPKSTYWWLATEQGLVENASALAYIVGLFIALVLARRTQGWVRAHWILWAVLCFVFFGEETSWTQQWFGYATPDTVKVHNAQSEFNLHNMDLFKADVQIFTPRGVSFSWKSLLNSTLLFELGFTAYFLMLPLLMYLPAIRNLGARFGFPRVSMRFVWMVWLPLVVNVVLTIASRGDPEKKALVAETRELYFATAIALFTWIALRLVKRRSRAAEGWRGLAGSDGSASRA